MGLIEWIQNLFKSNKKNAQIHVQPLIKTYGDKTPLEIALYDGETPLIGKTIKINLNGVTYERITDTTGIAKLNINLQPEHYTPLISFGDDEYNTINTFTDIYIKSDTRMEGTNINMTYKDGTIYQCAVYNNRGRVAGDVDITINGVTYRRTPDNTGLYKLNINLEPGTYTVTAKYAGDILNNPSSITNTVVVNKKPEPKPEPQPQPTPTPAKLYPYITQQGGGKLGQTNGYRCGPHSLMQCIYRLTGIELSESTLAGVCGTTTGGTSHSGLETGLAWFNRKYGYNLKMVWKNFSEIGFDGMQKYIDQGALLFHLLYRRTSDGGGDGHYEVPQKLSGDNVIILNSLGSYCSYPAYCGYIEPRSKSTQKYYIDGISQKSVCIITR